MDDLLAFFGGRSQPLMAQLVESGHLTLDDVKEAERLIRRQKADEAMTARWTGPLLDHVWQSTWFAAGCALLALALRHREARLRGMLWCAAVVKFLVPWPALVSRWATRDERLVAR